MTVSAGTLTVGGTIGDGGNGYSLTKAGPGTLVLSGNGNFSGGMIVNGGTLNLVGDRGFNAGIFTSGGAYTINSGAVLLTGAGQPTGTPIPSSSTAGH